MQPGLSRFGTDFGNGAADQLYFPRDADSERYRREKAAVLAHHPGRFAWCEGSAEQRALAHVAVWIRARIEQEHGGSSIVPGAARDFDVHDYDALARQVAEDLVVMALDSQGRERAILVHVCFPSGWRPESIIGQSFAAIHAPVPEMDAVTKATPALVTAMITRGPYVRFVWGVSADARLDHHPEHGTRDTWSDTTRPGYLRVERQLLIPFPDVGASLFLIRTYLYAFDELTAEQRETLASALEQTSEAILEYKGLGQSLPDVLALLRE